MLHHHYAIMAKRHHIPTGTPAIIGVGDTQTLYVIRERMGTLIMLKSYKGSTARRGFGNEPDGERTPPCRGGPWERNP